MTEYEYIYLISELRQETAIHAMNFFAIWSAYLLTVYIVIRNLSGLYTFLLTFIYSLFIYAPARASQASIENTYNLIDRYQMTYPQSALMEPVTNIVDILLLIVHLIAWAISILFMIHRRKSKENDANT